MNPAETPSIINTYDCPSLQFDHESGGWAEADEDLYELTQSTTRFAGMGVVSVCPECAFFAEGRCTWCPGEDDPDYPSDRPECFSCLGTKRAKEPWYQRSEIMVPLFTTIAVTVVATVASTIVLRRTGYGK